VARSARLLFVEAVAVVVAESYWLEQLAAKRPWDDVVAAAVLLLHIEAEETAAMGVAAVQVAAVLRDPLHALLLPAGLEGIAVVDS
jgi:hypothetical protein